MVLLGDLCPLVSQATDRNGCVVVAALAETLGSDIDFVGARGCLQSVEVKSTVTVGLNSIVSTVASGERRQRAAPSRPLNTACYCVVSIHVRWLLLQGNG